MPAYYLSVFLLFSRHFSIESVYACVLSNGSCSVCGDVATTSHCRQTIRKFQIWLRLMRSIWCARCAIAPLRIAPLASFLLRIWIMNWWWRRHAERFGLERGGTWALDSFYWNALLNERRSDEWHLMRERWFVVGAAWFTKREICKELNWITWKWGFFLHKCIVILVTFGIEYKNCSQRGCWSLKYWFFIDLDDWCTEERL